MRRQAGCLFLRKKNPGLDNGSGITVVIGKKCAEGECRPDVDIMTHSTMTGTCKVSEVASSTQFAGESCTVNDDCNIMSSQFTVQNCTSANKCYGKIVGEPCANNWQCVVGSFCFSNATSGESNCTKQYTTGTNCTSEKQCVNNNYCQFASLDAPNGQCQPYATVQENGLYYNFQNADACVSGYSKNTTADQKTQQCWYPDYSDPSKAVDGFVKCSYHDVSLNYTDNTTKECQCGYNANGDAYYPLAPKQKPKAFDELQAAKIKTYSDNCHTEKRSICNNALDNNNDALKEYLTKLDASVKANLYKDKVPCVSGSSIKVSLIILALVTFMF